MCSALITLLAAKVHHLCYSVDYKRGVLEILLNSKEALIMLSTVLHTINAQKGLIHVHRNSLFLRMRLNFLYKRSIVLTKFKDILRRHLLK